LTTINKALIEFVAKKIAGDIIFSENPGLAMRKWREFFNIQQSKLANRLNISPSVLSDYESGRRRSPGTMVLKRFVNGLISMDLEYEDGKHLKLLLKTARMMPVIHGVLDIRDFSSPLTLSNLVEAIEGKVEYGKDMLENYIYGYTVIDSIVAIKELSGSEFLQLFGLTTQRALVFTSVSTGRSPMVALKVVDFKPGAVVLHKLKKVDALAIELAKIMKVPLIVSNVEAVEELIDRLRRLEQRVPHSSMT